MNFTHYDLGRKERGQIVEITLSGSAANVRLMDSANFQNYRNGRQHRYYGGLAKQSPIRLSIPNTGNWHVAIDMQGLRGTVRSSIRMMPSALPEFRQPALSTVPSLVHKNDDYPFDNSDKNEKQYDVFISHASEDKDDIVRDLAEALRNNGFEVWYDEFELKIGDSLRKKIDYGLSNANYGIVIISPSFVKKNWTEYELNGMVAREMNGHKVILPIWHKITKDEVLRFSPSLADKLALNTSIHTIDDIVENLKNL